MNTENIPQEKSMWLHDFYGVVVVSAVTNRGKPPGKQVRFKPTEIGSSQFATGSATSGLKKFLKAAKPL